MLKGKELVGEGQGMDNKTVGLVDRGKCLECGSVWKVEQEWPIIDDVQ